MTAFQASFLEAINQSSMTDSAKKELLREFRRYSQADAGEFLKMLMNVLGLNENTVLGEWIASHPKTYQIKDALGNYVDVGKSSIKRRPTALLEAPVKKQDNGTLWMDVFPGPEVTEGYNTCPDSVLGDNTITKNLIIVALQPSATKDDRTAAEEAIKKANHLLSLDLKCEPTSDQPLFKLTDKGELQMCFKQEISTINEPRTEGVTVMAKRTQYDSSRGTPYKLEGPIENAWDFSDENSKYGLTFAIRQSGNANWGHYIAYRKIGEQWFCYNDGSVSEINEEKAKEQTALAYIFYYEKVKSAEEITPAAES
jgi:hypothetical protein